MNIITLAMLFGLVVLAVMVVAATCLALLVVAFRERIFGSRK